MKQLLLHTKGASSWRYALADPETHWKPGRSAYETAISWESAKALPASIASLLNTHSDWHDSTLGLAVVEHPVSLRGRGKPSFSDVWALIRTPQGLASVSVEGKAGEPFGPLLGEWLDEGIARGKPEGRQERLRQLLELLGLVQPPRQVRYQLLHRLASAVLEAQRLGLNMAAMIVQAFPGAEKAYSDFVAFANVIQLTPPQGVLVGPVDCGGIRVYVGWKDCPVANERAVASAI